MINIQDKTKCCGCTACANICPKGAIEMAPDEEGFLYPRVDVNKCVNCGLCDQMCPVLKAPKAGFDVPESFALRVKNEDTLMQSTSGGFVTPLLRWVFEQKGVVCAATYDGDFRVVHTITEGVNDHREQLSRIRGSKYVQSALGDSFGQIKSLLQENRLVCFVGTTCQVAGLKAFLGKEYENLITVDLVCHGTPSPKLWDKYLVYQKEKYGAGISQISFRNKTYGYHSGTMRIRFDNGKEYYGSARVDYMLKSFFREISSRPSCYQCAFKTLNRCSDFTIYDCWHAEQLVPGLKDDDRGYTNVMVQSARGKEVLEQIKSAYEIYAVNTQKAVALDGSMVLHSARPHARRREYYQGLDERSLPEHIQKFIPVSTKDRLLEAVKCVVYKAGLLQTAKALKERNENRKKKQ